MSLPTLKRKSSDETDTHPHKKPKISYRQKQMLINDLQVEITERARQLRSQYALQAADLRARIERRIVRISPSLRSVTMGELLLKYSESTTSMSPKPPTQNIATSTVKMIAEISKALPPLPRNTSSKPPTSARPAPLPLSTRVTGTREPLPSTIQIDSDKENEDARPTSTNAHPLPIKNPKRTRVAPASRATSRIVASQATSSVLSPRSHNSQTLPWSPVKETAPPASPTKTQPPYISRPVSPLKPASPLKTAATAAATSAITAALHGIAEQAKRGTTVASKMGRTASKEKVKTKTDMPPPPRPALRKDLRVVSDQSNASASSTSTTVVKKTNATGRAGKATTTSTQATTTTTTKKPAGPTASAAAKKTPAKKVVIAEPAAGKRVLRKRT